MFSSQLIYCCVCGKQYKTDFGLFNGVVCSWQCWDELKWRQALSIIGEEYKPMPEEVKINKSRYEK